MSKRHICNSKFHACNHFFNIYQNPRRKNFIHPSCPKHPKIDGKFLFSYFFVVPQKALMKAGTPSQNLFEPPKRKGKINKLCHFSSLFRIGMTVFVDLPIYAVSISLKIEIHKNRT